MSQEQTTPEINSQNIKVLVTTSFVKPSGEHGTPMFSRVGKQTATEILEFQGEPMVQGISSFQKARDLDKEAKQNALLAAEKPDEHTLKDFSKKQTVMAESNPEAIKKVSKKKGKKGKVTIEDEPRILNPGDPDYLKAIMEHISEEQKHKIWEDKQRDRRAKNMNAILKDPMDIQAQKKIFYEMQSPFKDKVARDNEPVYKILADVPKNLNEGLHRVKFDNVDKKEKAAVILPNATTNPKTRLFHIAPCVLNTTECNYQNRQKAKQQNSQVFNSVLQVENEFYKTRNVGENFENLRKTFVIKKQNIEEGKPRTQQNRAQSEAAIKEDVRRGSSVSASNVSPSNNNQAQSLADKINMTLQKKITDMMKVKTPGGVESAPSSSHPEKAKFSRAFNQILTGPSTTIRHNSQRPHYPEPSMEKGMGAPYLGYYAKTFQASSKDGTYHSKSKANNHQFITREENNQAGKDIDFEQVVKYIPSPINFSSVKERQPFSKYGVFGQYTLNENRFILNENEFNTTNTKYDNYNSPDFGKWAKHSLDEFIKNHSSTANENANHINYYPNHSLVSRNEMVGIPDFTRYSPRKSKFEGKEQNLSTIDPLKVVSGFYKTMTRLPDACPFSSLMSRDNLYQRQNGLPKETKEESVKRQKMQKEYVSAVDFLPNNILKSPQKHINSNTVRTQALNLYHMDKFVLNNGKITPMEQSFTRESTGLSTGRHTDLGKIHSRTMDFEDCYKYPLNDSSLKRGGSTVTRASKFKMTNELPSSIGHSPMNFSSGEFDSRLNHSDFRVRNKFSEIYETPMRRNLEQIDEGSPISII